MVQGLLCTEPAPAFPGDCRDKVRYKSLFRDGRRGYYPECADGLRRVGNHGERIETEEAEFAGEVEKPED